MAIHFRPKFKFTPAFKAMIDESSRVIFGNLPIVPYRTGFKYLKRKPMGALVVQHYIPDVSKEIRRDDPTFRTDEEQSRLEKLDRLRFRGKGPPKKGHGKRASKKKK